MDTTLTIKTNKGVRDAAKKTAKELGLPLTTVLNALLKQFVRDREITLSARTPNTETQHTLQEVQKHKNLETFGSFDQWKKSVRLS
jgi:addiction module RelB/DinJ family antitoxin